MLKASMNQDLHVKQSNRENTWKVFQANKTGKCGNSHPLIQNTVPSLSCPLHRACDSWKAPTSWKVRGRRPGTIPKSKNSYWTFSGGIFYFFSQKMNFCHTIAEHSDENQNIWVLVLHLTTHCHSFGSELKPPYLTICKQLRVCKEYFFLIHMSINKEDYLNKLQYMELWLLGRC